MASADRLPIVVVLLAFGFLLLVTLNRLLVVVGLVLLIGGLMVLSSWAFARRVEVRGNEERPGPGASSPAKLGWYAGLRDRWRSDGKAISIDLLRLGVGLVWVVNMIFIVDPANQFFSTFQDVALSFAPTTLGGPGAANFAAAHATVFAWLTVGVTAYLALAFVLGITTRLACLVGSAASIAFLLTQYGSTFEIPGGTDVGAHPLYLVIYLVLFVGGAGKYLALDHRVWSTGPARFPRLTTWLATPRP